MNLHQVDSSIQSYQTEHYPENIYCSCKMQKKKSQDGQKKDGEESKLDLLSEPYIVWIQGLLKLHVNSHGIQNVHL